MDITKIDSEKLKAMAYDCIALKERAERNLAAINQELAKRGEEKEEPKKKA